MYSQGNPSRPFYPNYNDQRPPSVPHRPQTPGGYSSGYVQPSLNRSYHKLPNQGYNVPNQGYNIVNNQRNNFSRSRVSLASSQASHLSNLANEPDVFP